ncbi:MAG: phosphotransferase [Gemmatimonadaceae bacterium]|nr:phosphotransferase [Gemmatimonadaceae bacterium]
MLSPSDRVVAVRDRALPGLATVLDVEAAAALVAAMLPDPPAGAPRMTYTRYKPGASCLVSLQYDDGEAAAFVTLKAVGTEAHEKWAKYRESSRVVSCADERIAIRRFPNDGELAGPRWLLDPARREQVLATLGLPAACTFRVIAYKPERRLVAMAQVRGEPVAVIKCHDGVAFANALTAHRALARLPHLPVSPATAWEAKRGVIVAPWIGGRLLDLRADPLDHVSAAGAALAAVHDGTMDVRAGETDADANVGLHRVAAAVSGWSPVVREPLRLLVGRLAQLRAESPAPVTPIHGDFYAKQVLVHDGTISLLDFDECTLSDPHIDLAIFAAHLERDVLRRGCTRERATALVAALLDGYGRSRAVDMRRFTWRTAEALMRLTPHPFRHRDPDWPTLTERLVARAQSLLDGIPGAIRPRRTGSCTPVKPVELRAWARLGDDTALAFATALASPETATRVLAQRHSSPAVDDVQVASTALVRHKAGRRCMVSFEVCDGGATSTWLGKVRARGVDSRAAIVHRMLWDAGARDVIAEPLGVVDGLRMTLQRRLPGVPLVTALAQGGNPGTLAAALAQSVSRVHELDVHPGRAWTLDDELRILRTRLASLRLAQPEHARPLLWIMERLDGVAAPLAARDHVAVLHRDLYHDQVLVHEGRCLLVDLDLVATGDPALDCGNLVAHLLELQWRGGIAARVVSEFCVAFSAEMVVRAAGSITEDAIVRHVFLALGRLLEIASRHTDRAAFLPAHLSMLGDRLAECGPRLELAALMEVPAWLAA